jgi:excisionase family DNA binding protein
VLTVAELANYLHLHPSTVYRLLKRKEIPGFRIGNDWRFNIEAIDEWRFGKSSAPEKTSRD